MKDESQNDGIDQQVSDATVEHRRRLLKGIVASAPVVASVASRPVLAARNCSESGQLSGNASDTGPACGGEGCTSDFWKANTALWHYDYPPGAVFDTVFGVSVFGSATFKEVINQLAPVTGTVACQTGGGAPDPSIKTLGVEAVAALQNAATSVSYDLTVGQVIASVQLAITGDCTAVEDAKTTLESLNNQGCPF